MSLKNFTSQCVGAAQSCAQEGTPAFCGAATAAILDRKSNVIANESQQSPAGRRRHDWNQ
jgi:hypothetical protein